MSVTASKRNSKPSPLAAYWLQFKPLEGKMDEYELKEGENAFNEGKTIDFNPYMEFSLSWNWWREGWLHAQKKETGV